jgi:thiamine biosynthesis lipoprotein
MVTAGIINAGGDLRTFEPALQRIHVRHPAKPTRAAGAVRLRKRAMATSGIYFERRKHHAQLVSPLLNRRTGQSARQITSVSVAAAECVAADALTKIVFALREKAANLLTRYHADALLLSAMARHPGCFSLRATRATRLDPIEALAKILSLRRSCAAFLKQSRMGILELYGGVAR